MGAGYQQNGSYSRKRALRNLTTGKTCGNYPVNGDGQTPEHAAENMDYDDSCKQPKNVIGITVSKKMVQYATEFTPISDRFMLLMPQP